MQALFLLSQHLVPQHWLSRLVGLFAASENRVLKTLLIKNFIRRYGVDMEEAEHEDIAAYTSFNDFFTRRLRSGARPIAGETDAVVCPADGVVSAAGDIHRGRLLQAKGRGFSLTDLLGGDAARAAPFEGGSFATVYLSPRDYHRVHMPVSGTLREMIYLPGRLFSVNQVTADNVPNLFARNERAVCLFDTEPGPMAVVLVGAMIVAAIDTVWAGRVCPAGKQVRSWDYTGQAGPLRLEKGEEMGRFSLGSTVIVLFGPGRVGWLREITAGATVRMGQQLGRSRSP